MKRHTHAKLCCFGPRLAMKRALRVERRDERVGSSVERRAKSVAAGLEHVAVVVANAVAQQRIVARQRGAHRRSVRFPEPRAALDVGEQKRDGAGRKICHGGSPPRTADYANDN
jgi:hypothetical protein